jgi:hypothetical protein
LGRCLEALEDDVRQCRECPEGVYRTLAAVLRAGAAVLDLVAEGTPLRTLLAQQLEVLPASPLATRQVRDLRAALQNHRGDVDVNCGRFARWLHEIAKAVDERATPRQAAPPPLTVQSLDLTEKERLLYDFLETRGPTTERKAIKYLWTCSGEPTEKQRARLRQLTCRLNTKLATQNWPRLVARTRGTPTAEATLRLAWS